METQTNLAFRGIFFALFFTVLVIRGYYGWKLRQAGQRSGAVTQEAIEREGMWSLVLRFILFLYMMAVAIVFAINPPWLNLFAAPFPAWSRWTGVGLAVISLPLLIWVHHTLGRHWSTNLQLKQNHTLITEGPYRWVQHPMYTALFGFFGAGACLGELADRDSGRGRNSGVVCTDRQGRGDDDRSVWRRVPRLHAARGTLAAALVNCHECRSSKGWRFA